MEGKIKKPFYKRWWFIVLTIIVVIIVIGPLGNNTPKGGTGEQAGTVGATENRVEESDNGSREIKEIEEYKKPEQIEKPKKDVPKEYQSALKKASLYSNEMHMSKTGLYKQLISEYGENFSEEAAQYAIDNVGSNWKENALKKAILYQDEMAMSPNAIYEQLISEYGEQFTKEEAKYAIDNLPQ